MRSKRVGFELNVPAYAFDKINVQKWLMTTFKINRLPDVHIVDRYLDTVKSFKVENDGEGLDYFLPNSDEMMQKSISEKIPEFDFEKLVLEKEFESEQVKVRDLKIDQRNLIIAMLILSLACTMAVFFFVSKQLKKRVLTVEKDKRLTESEFKLKSHELTAKSEQVRAYAEEMSRIKAESNHVTKTDQLTRLLEVGHLQAKDWASFRISFDELFPNFFPFLEKHSLTVNEERLSCLIKLGLATKEMAQVLAITPNSVIKAKSRLSSKLNLSTQEIEHFMKDH